MMTIFCTLLFTLTFTQTFPLLVAISISLITSLSPFSATHFTCLDQSSLFLIILSLWLALILNTMKTPLTMVMIVNMLTLILLLFFSCNSLITLYITFETSLLPIFLIILLWGYQPERQPASFYLMFYMVTSSLPLLAALILSSKLSTMNFFSNKTFFVPTVLTFTLLLAFLVKLPLFFTHLWLLKAHVEAPVQGSMILAALLLKTGGYGVVRVLSLTALPFKLTNMFLVWSLVGAFLVSVICAFQKDVKQLIALSSVAHMGLMSAALFTSSPYGLGGAIIIMVGHGFSSSGLFFAANASYLMSKTRSMKILKSVSSLTPFMLLPWFILAVSNMAAPPSLNTLGEILSIIALLMFTKMSIPFSALLVFLAALYSLSLFNSILHKKQFKFLPFYLPQGESFFTMALHWVPVFVIVSKIGDL